MTEQITEAATQMTATAFAAAAGELGEAAAEGAVLATSGVPNEDIEEPVLSPSCLSFAVRLSYNKRYCPSSSITVLSGNIPPVQEVVSEKSDPLAISEMCGEATFVGEGRRGAQVERTTGSLRIGRWLAPNESASVTLKRGDKKAQSFSCVPVVGICRNVDGAWLYNCKVEFDSDPEFTFVVYGHSSEEEGEDEVCSVSEGEMDGVEPLWGSITLELSDGLLHVFLDNKEKAVAVLPVTADVLCAPPSCGYALSGDAYDKSTHSCADMHVQAEPKKEKKQRTATAAEKSYQINKKKKKKIKKKKEEGSSEED